MDPTQAAAPTPTNDSWQAIAASIVALGGLGVFGVALFFRNVKHGLRSRRR